MRAALGSRQQTGGYRPVAEPLWGSRAPLDADSDEVGRCFQSGSRTPFRYEAGRDSDLMPDNLSFVSSGRGDHLCVVLEGQA